MNGYFAPQCLTHTLEQQRWTQPRGMGNYFWQHSCLGHCLVTRVVLTYYANPLPLPVLFSNKMYVSKNSFSPFKIRVSLLKGRWHSISISLLEAFQACLINPLPTPLQGTLDALQRQLGMAERIIVCRGRCARKSHLCCLWAVWTQTNFKTPMRLTMAIKVKLVLSRPLNT